MHEYSATGFCIHLLKGCRYFSVVIHNKALCRILNDQVYITGLTHWGRVTHICVSKLTIIDSDNGLSPGRRQAIIWTNAGISLIGPLGTNFSETLIEILTFSFKKMRMKVSSAKRRPFCLGLNVLTLLMLETEYSGFGGQYHTCWCHDS